MKIKALYITNLGLLDNLAKTQVLPYLEGLAKEGIALHVLSFEKTEYLEETDKVNKMQKRLADALIKWDHLVYHRRWGNIYDVIHGLCMGFNVIRANDIRVLHARSSIPIFIAWPLAKITKCRLIYDRRGTMVGDFVDDVNLKNMFSINIFSIILNKIEMFLIKRSDATVVLSERALAALRNDKSLSELEPVFEHIPCCADIRRFRDGVNGRSLTSDLRGRFVVTYVGSLGTCYLLEQMARFFKVLKKKKGNAVLSIVSHTDREYIEGILNKEGLVPDTDYMITCVDPEDVPSAISGSDCSIMFIKPVECKVGSSPTKFAESLSAGIPVIVNKGIGDTEKVITEKRVGVVVKGLDDASYEKAVDEILIILADSALKKRCVDTAEESFSLDLGIKRYLNVYERIIG